MIQHALLLQTIYLFGALALIATVFHYLKIPTLIGFILAGIAIGPFGLGLVSSIPGAKAISEIAVLFLMFTIGLEFSLNRLKRYKRAFFGLGGLQVLLTCSLTFLFCHFMVNLSLEKSLVASFVVTLSSTAIVMKLLHESRESNSPYGNNAFGILIFQDLLALPMILVLPFLGQSTELESNLPSANFMPWLAKVALLVVSLAFGSKYFFPWVFQRVVKTKSREIFFFGVLFFFLTVAVLMEHIGLSLSLGAFFAGLILSESPYGKQASADFIPLRDNFLGLFFASIGLLIDPVFVFNHFGLLLSLFALITLGKASIVLLSGFLLGYPFKMTCLTALLIFQIGEFSLVILDLAAGFKILSQDEMQLFVSASVLTMMATPFVNQYAPKYILGQNTFHRQLGYLEKLGIRHVVQLPKTLEKDSKETSSSQAKPLVEAYQTLVIGYGVAGRHIASAMKELGVSVAIIDQNIDVVKARKKAGDHIIYGDATASDVLHLAGLEHAQLVVVVASGIEMTRAIVEAIRRQRPEVEIVIRLQYSLEKEHFKKYSNVTIVVAEFETTIEILAKCLSSFGASEKKISELMSQARDGFGQNDQSRSDLMRRSIELPKWEVVSAIKHFQITKENFACGKTLVDLDLRAETGASVLAVYRETLGTVIPDLDFEFAQGDTVHLLASSEKYPKAIEVFDKGPQGIRTALA